MYIKDQLGGRSIVPDGGTGQHASFRLAGQAWSNVNIVAIRRGRRARGLAWSCGARRTASGGLVSHATRPGLPAAGLPGTVAGYRLDGYVGQGSRAVVYLAQDERLQRRVALKMMMPELARDTGFRTGMISESRTAAALGHPNIVPVFQADEADGILYAAMRYITGGDGRSLLSGHGPLPLGKAWQTIAQIASALDAAHAHGLIHRDARPA